MVTGNPGGDEIAIATAPFLGRKDWLLAAALIAAVFLVYQPSWHGGFLWDDDFLLLNDPVLKPGGLAKIWVPGGYLNYWPLTYTAYWLQFQLWGLQPLGYHLVNLALHCLAALLAWRVLVRLHVPGAMFAAAIFALHPVNVESVAWIAQLKGILALVLALVSVLFYLSYERHEGWWRYALAVAAFLLSALAKGTALTLPVVLLACAWWQRGRIQRRDLLRVLPYLLIGVAMSGVEMWTQHNVGGEVARSDGIFSRAAIAGCAVWFYLGKLIWPLKLCPVYPRWTIGDPGILWYLPGLILVVLLAWAWRRRRTWGRPVVMLIVCYVALLLPVLGFVNIAFMQYSLVADHWQYIATIVPCAMFAGISVTLARRFLPPPAAYSAAAALLIVLAILSSRESRMYADVETFYGTTIARNPHCWLAHSNFGVVLARRGQSELAIAEFQKALEINPDYAQAHYNLGNSLLGRHQVDAAIAHYQKALEIKPDHAEAHNNLGNVLLGRGQLEAAIDHYQKALKAPNFAEAPDFAGAHNNLAMALAGRGQIDAAIDHYEKALEIKPDFAPAHKNLADILAGRGQFDLAIVHYQKALEIKPDYALARKNLAAVVSARDKILKSLAEQREAIRLHPNDAALLNDAAWTLATNPNASVRNGAEAVELALRASKLSGGNDPAILGTLAAAYAEAGRFSDAVRTGQQSQRLAVAAGNHKLADQLGAEMGFFNSGKPYRQTPSQ
jgi:tetratricopeptide (TPR) repeat protein